MIVPELSIAALLLVGFLIALFIHDWSHKARNPRLLTIQGVVFAGGAFLIVFPDIATRLAHAVGIGRGVDFVIYPVVIWLVRESLVSRRERRRNEERITELVRAIAMEGATSTAPRGEGPLLAAEPTPSLRDEAS